MMVIALLQGGGGFKYLKTIKLGFCTEICDVVVQLSNVCGLDLMIYWASDNQGDEKLIEQVKI